MLKQTMDRCKKYLNKRIQSVSLNLFSLKMKYLFF